MFFIITFRKQNHGCFIQPMCKYIFRMHKYKKAKLQRHIFVRWNIDRKNIGTKKMEKEPKNDGRKKCRKEEKKKRRIGMRNGEKKE